MGADVPILFSPQQVASCVTTMDGCGGGDTAVAFTYLQVSMPIKSWSEVRVLLPYCYLPCDVRVRNMVLLLLRFGSTHRV